MSLPRDRIALILATIVVALAIVVPGAGAAVRVHRGAHHGTRAVWVCWTPKRHHGKHHRMCHLRVATAHRTHSHRATKRFQVKAAHRNRPPHATPVQVGPAMSSSPAGAGAASIASVLATPCQGTELMPQTGDLEAIRSATLCLINQERARNGEASLRASGELEQAAQGHSDEMVSGDYFDHVSPSGESPLQRIQATGYVPGPPAGYAIGENIAWGTLSLATPSAIVNAWIASPEHLANILKASYRDTAIGVSPAAPVSLAQGQAGAVYSQEFGVILR